MSLDREKKEQLICCNDSSLETGTFVTHKLDKTSRGLVVSSQEKGTYEVLWSKSPSTVDYKSYKNIRAAIDNILHKDVDIEASLPAASSGTGMKINYVPVSHISKLVGDWRNQKS